MASKPRHGGSWITFLVVAAAVALWAYEQRNPGNSPPKPEVPSRQEAPAPTRKNPTAGNRAEPKRDTPPASKSETQGGYEVYHGCQLAEDRNNDGDSFRVRLPDGRTEIFRLYYVDTPESAFKSYRGGETNHPRISEQAAAMGGITSQQAVKVGQDAKHFTLALLAGQRFELMTRWDSPFHDQRYHAFIRVDRAGTPRWLHELLVEKGFVRIHTKPAPLPDGTSTAKHQAHLKELERMAKKAGAGAWGL